jgi:hypothetical protein
MHNGFSKGGILRQGFLAAISGALSYLIVCSALHIPLWAPNWEPNAGDDLKYYFSIGSGLAVFVVVLFRIRRDTWTREHIDELLKVDVDD